MESAPGSRIQWDCNNIRRMIKAVDDYVCEYLPTFRTEESDVTQWDWDVIAYNAFKRKDVASEALGHYSHLKTYTIETLDEYDVFNKIPCCNKFTWMKLRHDLKWLTEYNRHIIRTKSKACWEDCKKSLAEDLAILVQDCNMEGIHSRDMWNYLGGEQRVPYAIYLDIADNIVQRLPFNIHQMDEWPVTLGAFDINSIKEKWGTIFDREQNASLLSHRYYPLFDHKDNMVFVEEKPCIRKRLDASIVEDLMQRLANGFFSCTEWRILTNDDKFLWGPYARNDESSLDNGVPNETQWVFKKEIARLGIRTSKTHQRILLEFYAFILPNYWLLRDSARNETNVITRALNSSTHFRGWTLKYITVYHSLTFISLKHVRKTILHLLSLSTTTIGHDKVALNEWTIKFLEELVAVPCGECWLADPEEFERVRWRLLWEQEQEPKDTVRSITDLNTSKLGSRVCINGSACYWKSDGRTSVRPWYEWVSQMKKD